MSSQGVQHVTCTSKKWNLSVPSRLSFWCIETGAVICSWAWRLRCECSLWYKQSRVSASEARLRPGSSFLAAIYCIPLLARGGVGGLLPTNGRHHSPSTAWWWVQSLCQSSVTMPCYSFQLDWLPWHWLIPSSCSSDTSYAKCPCHVLFRPVVKLFISECISLQFDCKSTFLIRYSIWYSSLNR